MSTNLKIEINVRVPDISVNTPQEPVRRIANSDARFWTVIDVPALPKIGDALELSSRTHAFQATVKRLDWHDEKDRFVAVCHYAKRSMKAEEYDSLRADPSWTMKPLLSGT